MELLKGLNLVLAFTLELAMLVAFGYFGFQSADGAPLRWVLAVALPMAAAALWGAILAPKAAHRLPILPGTALSLGLFLLAALALQMAGQPVLAVVFAVAAVIHAALGLLWQQW